MTGHETATAKRQGRDSPSLSAAEGNAAASNYPGLVMRHLARVPRPRADTRGAVLVQFSVTEGGRLASTRLDRAALTVVERAAPFPAPPAGADRSFSVQIKGE
jgi:protein TonB